MRQPVGDGRPVGGNLDTAWISILLVHLKGASQSEKHHISLFFEHHIQIQLQVALQPKLCVTSPPKAPSLPHLYQVFTGQQ